jgi:hypothetical protein
MKKNLEQRESCLLVELYIHAADGTKSAPCVRLFCAPLKISSQRAVAAAV